MRITELLGKQLLFKDGAMGTMLLARGLPVGKSPEEWNVENPAAVLDVHRAYAQAGANLIVSNTFGGNAHRLRKSAYPLERLVAEGVKLARQAADEAAAPCFAAMSVGPLGLLLEPFGDTEPDEAEALFRPAVQAGAEAGADCFLIETMGDLREAGAAVRACRSVSDLPVLVTLTFCENGRLFTGPDAYEAARFLAALDAAAVGCNCGLGPEQMPQLLEAFRKSTRLPLAMHPNAGLPRVTDSGATVYDVSPDSFAQSMLALRDGGAMLLGGCCGTTPAHIRALVSACR